MYNSNVNQTTQSKQLTRKNVIIIYYMLIIDRDQVKFPWGLRQKILLSENIFFTMFNNVIYLPVI